MVIYVTWVEIEHSDKCRWYDQENDFKLYMALILFIKDTNLILILVLHMEVTEEYIKS